MNMTMKFTYKRHSFVGKLWTCVRKQKEQGLLGCRCTEELLHKEGHLLIIKLLKQYVTSSV